MKKPAPAALLPSLMPRSNSIVAVILAFGFGFSMRLYDGKIEAGNDAFDENNVDG